MMGFDPRKWLTGATSSMSPQPQPTLGAFYGVPGAGTQGQSTLDAIARNRRTGIGNLQAQSLSNFAKAKEDWAFDEDIRQRKLAKMAELMEYGQKDLNPRPPSHTFVGESGGVEVSWPDMIGEQAYLDLDQPIDRLTSYEDEAERRRRALLARYLA